MGSFCGTNPIFPGNPDSNALFGKPNGYNTTCDPAMIMGDPPGPINPY